MSLSSLLFAKGNASTSCCAPWGFSPHLTISCNQRLVCLSRPISRDSPLCLDCSTVLLDIPVYLCNVPDLTSSVLMDNWIVSNLLAVRKMLRWITWNTYHVIHVSMDLYGDFPNVVGWMERCACSLESCWQAALHGRYASGRQQHTRACFPSAWTREGAVKTLSPSHQVSEKRYLRGAFVLSHHKSADLFICLRGLYTSDPAFRKLILHFAFMKDLTSVPVFAEQN